MRILIVGDILGRPGRQFLCHELPQIRKKHEIDFTVVNGENLAGGFGVTRDTLESLRLSGVDVVTGGNHSYKKREGIELYNDYPWLIRPANTMPDAPGLGYGIYEWQDKKIAVINLLGQIFMPTWGSPFTAVDRVLEIIKEKGGVDCILVDMHAEATSEKNAMAYYLRGKVQAVYGTHTHIPTADHRIFNRKMAYVTDVGMTGPYDSIIGFDCETGITRYISVMNPRSELAKNMIEIWAMVLDVDMDTGMINSFERLTVRK